MLIILESCLEQDIDFVPVLRMHLLSSIQVMFQGLMDGWQCQGHLVTKA